MSLTRRHLIVLSLGVVLAGCSHRRRNERPTARDPGDLHPGETPELRALIQKYAHTYQMPENLLHRVIQRESGYNPTARNGNYYGLMQIDPRTAKTMGYDGPAEGLLDAETNLIYAGRYLRGAWLVSRGDEDMAIVWYSKGYYYEAKRMGILEETGLRG
jgi:soluble lytic murein transglycosylase-like protein